MHVCESVGRERDRKRGRGGQTMGYRAKNLSTAEHAPTGDINANQYEIGLRMKKESTQKLELRGRQKK